MPTWLIVVLSLLAGGIIGVVLVHLWFIYVFHKEGFLG